jgi:hypothetical protein
MLKLINLSTFMKQRTYLIIFMKQRTYLIIFVKQRTYLITLPDRPPRIREIRRRRNVTSSVRRRFVQGDLVRLLRFLRTFSTGNTTPAIPVNSSTPTTWGDLGAQTTRNVVAEPMP